MPTIVETWNGPGAHDAELTDVPLTAHGLHASGEKRAFEHWYFDARLDSGHTVVAFLTKRRPEQSARATPSIEVLVYHPDGTKQQVNASFATSECAFSTTDATVKIGPNTLEVLREPTETIYRVSVGAAGVHLALDFTNELPSWMPGKGETWYGERDHFGWVVAAPRARVSGVLTLDGLPQPVSGIGYADHNWGVGDMKRIIERWHWGRLYLEDYTFLFANVLTQKRFEHHRSQPIMLGKAGEVLLSTGEITLTEGPMVFHEEANRTYPQWLDIDAPGKLRLRLDVDRIIDAQDLLDEVPVVRSSIVKPLIHKLVGRPGYFRFDSDFTLTLHPGLSGTDETVQLVGRTLHEMVALR